MKNKTEFYNLYYEKLNLLMEFDNFKNTSSYKINSENKIKIVFLEKRTILFNDDINSFNNVLISFKPLTEKECINIITRNTAFQNHNSYAGLLDHQNHFGYLVNIKTHDFTELKEEL